MIRPGTNAPGSSNLMLVVVLFTCELRLAHYTWKEHMTSTATDAAAKTKAMHYGRWLILLPASVVGAWVAYLVIIFVNKVTAYFYLDPDSFLMRTLLETMGNMALGAALVYIGVYIAPSHKRVVAYVMAGLSISIESVMLFSALIVPTLNYWAVYGGVIFLLAALVTTYSILHEGLLIPRPSDVNE